MIAHRSSVLTQATINLIGGLCTLPSIAMKVALRVNLCMAWVSPSICLIL